MKERISIGARRIHWQNRKKKRVVKIPQILIGASSSNKLGCCKKISREVTQSWRISDSDNWTCFPGRPRTSSRRLIMSSRTDWSISCPSKTESQRVYWIWWKGLKSDDDDEEGESKRKRENSWSNRIGSMRNWEVMGLRRFATQRVSFHDQREF